jgi:hypothetical protein
MRTTEVHHSTEAGTQTIAREPLPGYNATGEEAHLSPLPSDLQSAGPEPTPVTAATAQHHQLWEDGILVLAEESFVIGPMDEALTTESVHSNPRREPEELHLQPEQEVVFVPSGPDETGSGFPPLRVHQRRKVVRARPDTAARYGNLYKLLTAAECIPRAVGEDLGRLTWALVYGSITAAKRAERILRRARQLAAG